MSTPVYVAETVLGEAVRHLGAAAADGLKPVAISQIAKTISCTASGAEWRR